MTKKKVQTKKVPHSLHVSYTVTDNSLNVIFSKSDHGRIKYITKSFDKGTIEYAEIKKAIADGKLHLIPKIAAKVETSIADYTAKFKEKFIKLENGVIFIDGKSVGDTLTKRIIKYAEEGLPYMDLVRFHRNLMKNPSYTAVTGLFRFLEANHYPLTDQGYFIGYKGVTADYKDLRTETMDNSPGKTVKMPRNECDEDPNVSCSRGLHLGNYSYISDTYGGEKKITVLVNPKDVVAVPHSYSERKMRVCEYKVLGDVSSEIKEQRVELFQEPDFPHNDNDEDDDYDEEATLQ